MAVELPMPGQLGFSYGYRFCRMPKLSGHWPGLPSTPGPRPGAHRVASPVQSPSVSCRHQLSIAACASTRSSSTPHLQAAQRRISRVVPVNCPSTRAAMRVPARGSSPVKKPVPTGWPVAWLARRFPPLFSGYGWTRTQAAHCAPDGSVAPGARVAKRAGAAAAAGRVLGPALALVAALGLALAGVAAAPAADGAGGATVPPAGQAACAEQAAAAAR